MNVTFAGFAGRHVEWGAHGNEEGAANLVAYQKRLAREDLSLTHTIIHPTIDKARGDAPMAGNDVALRKVGEHRARHRRSRRAHPGDARPVRRRDRRLPGVSAARQAPRPTRLRSRIPDGRRRGSSSSAATAAPAGRTSSTIRSRAASTSRTPSSSSTTSRCRGSGCSSTVTARSTTR